MQSLILKKCLGLCLAFALPYGALAAKDAALGATRIATWKDDKKVPFLMMFDDCCPTHVTNVYPELQKRAMTGTFYIVGDKPERKAKLAFWEQEAPHAATVVFGNHTMSHKAFTSVEHAEREIVGCNELIYRIMPGPKPRLISYASPGGAKHEITPEQINEIIGRHQLILRPPFKNHGAGIQYKTGADILAAIDNSAVSGETPYVIFHGVGGDWIPFDLPEFVALLDGLDKRRNTIWITDHISAHKYETARETTHIATEEFKDQKIVLTLKCATDPALYDMPLTLITKVPAGWKACMVTQNGQSKRVTIANGEVRFDALPVNSSIQLEPSL